MKCVILQPSYIPWRGFFHQIAKADVFIFYDDVQYDKRGWRNRNRIKTAHGPQWLTIPVSASGVQQEGTPINQIKIQNETAWQEEHWKTIEQAYAKAPYFDQYAYMLYEFYKRRTNYLVDFTVATTVALASILGLTDTRFIRSSSLDGIEGTKTERLINILTKLGADHYITGPSAENYIDHKQFDDRGIQLEFMEYNYPDYQQLHGDFEPQVSIIDLMFMQGSRALDFILV